MGGKNKEGYWIAPPTKRGKRRISYGAVVYKGTVIKLNDNVSLYNSEGLPFLAKVIAMFEDLTSDPPSKHLTVQWFYRFNDLVPKYHTKEMRKKVKDNELFISDHTDANFLDSVCEKIYVHSDDIPVSQALKSRIDFVCNSSYSIWNPTVKTLSVEDRFDISTQIDEKEKHKKKQVEGESEATPEKHSSKRKAESPSLMFILPCPKADRSTG
eukprot:Lithocolla_globosa_v1_NODE_6360_length_1098_cov_5.699904.p1 type:complete len:212 gc:universal NODE_6360_length_1098_cov_5.699904:1062-427(-)